MYFSSASSDIFSYFIEYFKFLYTFTFSSVNPRLTYLFQEPKRGDVIIFKFPDDESLYYVKRIIGEPGDIIDIKDGKIYLNNSETPLEEDYIKEPMIPEAPMHFEVPENGYFCMGDNRNSSGDARYWHNTYVYKNKIISKVIFRYFPNIGLIK